MQTAYDTYLARRHLQRAELADMLHTAERRVDDLRERLARLDTPDPAHFPPPNARAVPAPRALKPGNADTRRQLDFHRTMLAQLGGSRTCRGDAATSFFTYHRGSNQELSHG